MAITVILIFGFLMIFLVIQFLKYYKVLKTVHRIPGLGVTSFIVAILNVLRKPRSQWSAALFQYVIETTELMRKEGICRIYGISISNILMPAIFIFSAETVEPILSSSTLIEKGPEYKFFKVMFKNSSVLSPKDEWIKKRRIITPFFNYRMLLSFIEVFDRHSKGLVKKVQERSCDPIDIIPLTHYCTLSVIVETAIANNLNKKWKLEYTNAMYSFGQSVSERYLKPWLHSNYIWLLTNNGRSVMRKIQRLFDGLKEIIKEKKEEIRKECKENKLIQENSEKEDTRELRKTLVDMLVNHQLLHEPHKTLNDDEISKELNMILAAGNDSTSKCISWTLYHLGRLPEIQRRVYEEQLNIFGDDKERPVTWNDLQSMTYLDRVIKESLRLSPPFPTIARKITKDITIKGYKIPRESTVVCSIYSLHRNPEVFPEPEVFDPDRFLPEKCGDVSTYAYVPFSAGIRNCIGQKFAILEIKTAISNVIRNFEISSVDPYDKILICFMISLMPLGGLKLKFTERA